MVKDMIARLLLLAVGGSWNREVRSALSKTRRRFQVFVCEDCETKCV